jgi:hypothetical protein
MLRYLSTIIQKEFQMIFNKLHWIQKYDPLIKKRSYITVHLYNRSTESSEDTVFSTKGRMSFLLIRILPIHALNRDRNQPF